MERIDLESVLDDYAVQIGPLWWVPFHAWDETTTQIDARLVAGDGVIIPGGCDLWTADEVRSDCSAATAAVVADAEAAWARGEILVVGAGNGCFGATSLIAPVDGFSRDHVTEALARLRP